MKTCHASQPQPKSEYRPQQIRSGIFKSGCCGPNRPQGLSLSFQPELKAIVVREAEKGAVCGLPDSQGRVAGLISVGTCVGKVFRIGWDFSFRVWRNTQMEFDIRGFGRTTQRTQSRNGEIGLDSQAENDVRESHFLGQQSDHLGSRSAKASLPVLSSRFTFR